MLLEVKYIHTDAKMFDLNPALCVCFVFQIIDNYKESF